jgi:hypothetical protein
MNLEHLDAAQYKLADSRVLAVAVELSPELFAALAISAKLPDSAFPLASPADLKNALSRIADNEGVFDSPGVRIIPDDCDRFPNDFLPVIDRLDLIRKVYMSIIIAHEAESRRLINSVRREGAKSTASHPFDLEAL